MVATCTSLIPPPPLSLRRRSRLRQSVAAAGRLITPSSSSSFPSSYNGTSYTTWTCSSSSRRKEKLYTVTTPSNNPTTLTTETNLSASEVVRSFYEGINHRDLSSVEDLIAFDCVYEDLIFAQPFVGRKAILEFFEKFIDSISSDLVFVIDDISQQDNSAVGVTWHLEWKGRSFPFSKGCSFYRLDHINGGNLQIIYGRDCVEPAIKPGEFALIAISGVTWLLQKFPQLADRL
ncbi:uncharacterized protein LOC124927711 [Impatiens glandulifera]|uniref:uncharacterized protein LOC124927711 n=1 Tax=Impatiens glandulifera TaxID=253017 RepID=UPI001FB13F55|nr:uncharacterized protein LOC124927711 [Impatiens glandulifera]